MRTCRTLAGALVVLLALGLAYIPISSAPPPPNELLTQPHPLDQVFHAAAVSWLAERYEIPLFAPAIENIQLSEDSTWASAWIELTNPENGEVIPGEPIPAVAHWDGYNWQVFLPSDEDWPTLVRSAPADLQKHPTLATWLQLNEPLPLPQITQELSGYLLPWEGGKTVYLSRSVAHDADFPSGNAHYSFDFYVPQTMFNIHAAKAGTVWLYKDTVPNNNHDDVNYLVLQDTTTNPTTYQLYLHLAQGSIPPALKTIGAPVAQGQFIGVADNTGHTL